jgi:MinD superfamily P-loop ATPase
MIAYIDNNKCTRCGKCVQVCPMDVFGTLADVVYLEHQKDCMTCFLCEVECRADAIYVDPHRGHDAVYPWPA